MVPLVSHLLATRHEAWLSLWGGQKGPSQPHPQSRLPPSPAGGLLWASQGAELPLGSEHGPLESVAASTSTTSPVTREEDAS